MRIATLTALFSLLSPIHAQQPAPVPGPTAASTIARPPGQAASPELKPEDFCRVEGKVLSAATGEPVRKANLRLTRAEPSAAGLPTSYTTSTDASGQFAMRDIEPGRYLLSASRNGFVNAQYGARGPAQPGTTIALAKGQRMGSVEIKLTAHAVISGRVLDSDGEPVANAQVNTMRWRYSERGRQMMPAGYAGTNDLGEFRIFGLGPGRYFLKATYAMNQYGDAVDRSDRGGAAEEGYVPTYFPGTSDPAAAATIEVVPGQHLAGMELRLSKSKTVRVRGRVVSATGAGRAPVQVMLVPRDNAGFFERNTRAVAQGPEMRFEFAGIPPGSYTLQAMLFDGQSNYTARQHIDAGDTNVDNVTLQVTPGVPLSGDVRVEGAAAGGVNLADLRVMLRPKEPGIMFGLGGNDRVQSDGSFTLKNVSPGETTIVSVYGLPDGYYIKSARMGEQDALDGLNLTSGSGAPLRIAVAPGAAHIEGAIANDKHEPISGAAVVAVPENEKRRDQYQFVKMATTDQTGRYALKNLIPGDYRVYCWDNIESGAWMDPTFRKPFESKAKKITLHEGERATADLRPLPVE